ncbi:MAG TPA: DUF1080 domain-containing protein [Pirellulaceae bacterium]|jgi:hypothetical protein|nr:DUF1080 domain-containing protein [Pirellulaceae bacterium]
MLRLFAFAFLLALPTFVVAEEPKTSDKEASAGENGWISMFDGKTLEGWKASENKDAWSVKEGAIVCQGERSHLFYVGEGVPVKNFEFTAEVMTTPGSNAGIYFHTKWQEAGWPKFGYESQVNNSYVSDPKKTGSLYGEVNVSEAPAKDNEWFTYKITVKDNRVQIAIDGKTLVDYEEPAGKEAFSGDFERRLSPEGGTFALQCHDPKSVVYFKNLKFKPLK